MEVEQIEGQFEAAEIMYVCVYTYWAHNSVCGNSLYKAVKLPQDISAKMFVAI